MTDSGVIDMAVVIFAMALLSMIVTVVVTHLAKLRPWYLVRGTIVGALLGGMSSCSIKWGPGMETLWWAIAGLLIGLCIDGCRPNPPPKESDSLFP